MPTSQQTYTYRDGKKVLLDKQPDQFVVRAQPDRLEHIGIADAEPMSSASSRVTVRAADLEAAMSQARNLAPTHHAYQVAETGEDFLITDRIFVTFHQALPSAQVDAFAGRYGLIRLQAYSDREYLFQLTDHTGMNPVKLVVKLTEEEPLVAVADHDLNYRATTYAVARPTDPAYARQWHLHTGFNHPHFDIRASSRCDEAWDLLGNYGSPEVVVGVTDDGCKLDHTDFDSPDKFAGWGYFLGTRLFSRGDFGADPAKMYQPGADHGTSCAGVIAGEIDASLTVGAAPGCRLLPIKWESDGPSLFISDSKLLTALNFVADKVDILSNSWGITPTSIWPSRVTTRLAELAQSGGRRGRGILFLWAAGNENCPIEHSATVDVPYTGGWQLRPDGSVVWVGVRTARRFQNNLVGVPGVIHVAALASTAQRSHYSNYGPGIVVCAPTNNVHKYQRLSLAGLGVTTTTGSGGGVTDRFGGTSSATPLTAGIAALVISAHPELDVAQLISILKRTAAKDLNFDGYAKTPPASYDPNPTWDVSPIAPFDSGAFIDSGDPDGPWSPWFGHGRVDAPAAVAAALQLRGEPAQDLHYSSSPKLNIPDHNPAGIQDVIPVAEAGQVQSLQVSVDISHTWIGDLHLTLIAPDGTGVVLHNRAGGSGDNIQASYDSSNLPALASFNDHPVQGEWRLHVRDLAARDLGTLHSWSLTIGIKPGPLVVEDVAAVTIPDRDPAGIVRRLDLPANHTIKELAVSVDITHTWIGDLRVILVPPQGDQIALHDRAGGSADNLLQTWHTQDLPGLQALRGRDTGGAWQLKVADLASQDVGKLNYWKIEVTE
jgi:subtilisin-like proprotein convertase family protein